MTKTTRTTSTARSATRTLTEHTYTDDGGVTHSVRNGGYYTGCDRDVPRDWSNMMPGWPPPMKVNRLPRDVTCLECIAMEDA